MKRLVKTDALPVTRRTGLALALVTATISGVSVYINGYAVKHAPSALSFTTAKNLVAALILGAILLATPSRREIRPIARRLTAGRALLLAFIGIVSGGLAFALFFQGLAGSSPIQAAFVQKSLIIWVALLAVPLLGERIGWRHGAAIGLLIAGQFLITGQPGSAKPTGSLGLVLVATLLWSVEVVIARRLLPIVPPPILGAVRMSVGVAVLLLWLAFSRRLGQLGTGAMWSWALLTGVLLSGYVSTWLAALRRAPALDVTAILVIGAFITALLSWPPATHSSVALQGVGMILILMGAAATALLRPPATGATRQRADAGI